MKKKVLLCVLAVAVAATTMVGCKKNGTTGSAEGDVIKIGMFGPLSGPVATYGLSVKEAVQLAEKEVNAKGGINGKKVQVIFEDDQANPNQAVNAFNKLVDSEKVSAIIGGVTSGATAAVAQKATQRKIPMLTPTATEPSITKVGGEYVFRSCYLDSFQGISMAKYAANDLGKKTAAVLYNVGDDYSKGIAESFKKEFEAQGGKVVEYMSYNKDDKDFNAQLTKIKGSNPEVLMLPDYYNVVGVIAKQAKSLGITSQLIGVDGWDSSDLYKIGGDSVKGGQFINHYFQGDTAEQVKSFVDAYSKEYNKKPDALAALGYDAAKLMFKALEDAKTTDGAKVRDALAKLTLDGATGKISFDSDRNAVKGASILKVEGENYSLVKKINP
ncbi:ABC transporter substrate-binding protein [Clostridium sp. SYSU_GA19001]|uniref:ABC transporter substrate-binding protein n=1 Tax=Clostridium caldaquaticum TaxID=2940653 RepID=UPI00207711BA|nr:ABC transporter substrate-binding protein [Clostridium caldaquaticum]MCM8709798.1 ABC transporter substrate-binding protein [Clostridium caldaquaticum]